MGQFQDVWHTFGVIGIIGMPKGEERKEQKTLIEVIMAENFQILMTTPNN